MLRKTLLSLGLCALALPLVNMLHFRLLPVNVVFYTALQDGALTVALCALISWYGVFRRRVDRLCFAQTVLIMALGAYVYAISVPTVIDRSFSMYILEKLHQQGGGLRVEAFDAHITQEFMREHHLSEARLTEQMASGTLRIEEGCVRLTPRGERIATVTHWYRTHALPARRLLMDQYTDALIRPFAQPSQLGAYRCP